MREITQFAEYKVEIWRRPRQRHMRLTVRPEGHIRITCNGRRSKREIFTFIESSRDFIARCFRDLERQRCENPPRQIISGELFFYLGRRLPLQLIWSWKKRGSLQVVGDQIELLAPVGASAEERRDLLQKYYRLEAQQLLLSRMAFWVEKMGRGPKQVVVRGQSTRWGSCSASGQISLNWKLLCAPPEVLDYVIVHELAHLYHMDHSPRFWALVEQFFPDWRVAKLWLRKHESEIRAMFL